MHALLVLDVEVADGLAVVVDDAEAQRLRAAAAQLGVVHDQAQAVLGDREAADRARGLVGGRVHVSCGGRLVVAGLGADRGARERGSAEDDGEDGEEGGELGGGVHAEYELGVSIREP